MLALQLPLIYFNCARNWCWLRTTLLLIPESQLIFSIYASDKKVKVTSYTKLTYFYISCGFCTSVDVEIGSCYQLLKIVLEENFILNITLIFLAVHCNTIHIIWTWVSQTSYALNLCSVESPERWKVLWKYRAMLCSAVESRVIQCKAEQNCLV